MRIFTYLSRARVVIPVFSLRGTQGHTHEANSFTSGCLFPYDPIAKVVNIDKLSFQLLVRSDLTSRSHQVTYDPMLPLIFFPFRDPTPREQRGIDQYALKFALPTPLTTSHLPSRRVLAPVVMFLCQTRSQCCLPV